MQPFSYRIQWRGPRRPCTDFPAHNDYVWGWLSPSRARGQGGELRRRDRIARRWVSSSPAIFLSRSRTFQSTPPTAPASLATGSFEWEMAFNGLLGVSL